jgi:L-rhamnose-H+ transport protein
MKRMRTWNWENSWLVYSIVGLFLIPWVAALLTVPSLPTVYAQVSHRVLLRVIVFGIGWGIGSVLFGIGVSRLGLAVGYGIILGLIAPIGTFLPLAVLHPDRLFTREGQFLIAGMVLVLTGISFLAAAGRRREHELRAGQTTTAVSTGTFFSGLVICVLAGIFSPMVNFSFVFGQELQQKAAANGASIVMSANPVWALTLTAGCVVNAGYCLVLLKKNGTWPLFFGASSAGNVFGGSLMGLICFGSFMVYGMGATALGSAGGIVGWPLFMSMSLIASNILGALGGEWGGASRRAWSYSVAGIMVLIVAILVISRGNHS